MIVKNDKKNQKNQEPCSIGGVIELLPPTPSNQYSSLDSFVQSMFTIFN
jgi:hypothetical protein